MKDGLIERGKRLCARRELERYFAAMAALGYDRARAAALLREEWK